jgi:hypothetical protein
MTTKCKKYTSIFQGRPKFTIIGIFDSPGFYWNHYGGIRNFLESEEELLFVFLQTNVDIYLHITATIDFD